MQAKSKVSCGAGKETEIQCLRESCKGEAKPEQSRAMSEVSGRELQAERQSWARQYQDGRDGQEQRECIAQAQFRLISGIRDEQDRGRKSWKCEVRTRNPRTGRPRTGLLCPGKEWP